MKTNVVLAMFGFLLSLPGHADEKKIWDGSYKSFKGQYLIYSGDLGEQEPPRQRDRKGAFMIEGPLAKEMFDAIGPDLKDACGASSSLRIRQKGDLDCTFDKDHPSAPHTCHFGINLRTGKSIGGSIC